MRSAQLKCPTSALAILGAKIWFKSTKDLDTPSWTYLCFGNIRGNTWFLHKFGGVKRCKYHEAGEGGVRLGYRFPLGPRHELGASFGGLSPYHRRHSRRCRHRCHPHPQLGESVLFLVVVVVHTVVILIPHPPHPPHPHPFPSSLPSSLIHPHHLDYPCHWHHLNHTKPWQHPHHPHPGPHHALGTSVWHFSSTIITTFIIHGRPHCRHPLISSSSSSWSFSSHPPHPLSSWLYLRVHVTSWALQWGALVGHFGASRLCLCFWKARLFLTSSKLFYFYFPPTPALYKIHKKHVALCVPAWLAAGRTRRMRRMRKNGA